MEEEKNNKKKVGIIIAISLSVLLILGLVLFLVLRSKKIIIKFDSDGGSIVEEQRIKKGSTINIPESTKEGFTLDGWYIDEQKVTSDTTFNKNTTVKAKWTTNKPKTYKVTFDSKEGSKVEAIEVECNKELKLPDNPTKEGYVFISWVDKNSTPILDGALLSCEDVVLYANWQKKEEAKKYYTVKFDSKGGSNINSIQVECNTKLKLPTTKPTRTGYEFVSWADKNGKVILDGALLSCEDVILYANWKKIDESKETKYFTITFDSQGGSKVDSKKYECDKPISSLPTPTRSGYSFVAWYDKNGKTILNGALLSCDNLILYADWSENKPETPEKQYKCPAGYTLSEDKKKCTMETEVKEKCPDGTKIISGGLCATLTGSARKDYSKSCEKRFITYYSYAADTEGKVVNWGITGCAYYKTSDSSSTCESHGFKWVTPEKACYVKWDTTAVIKVCSHLTGYVDVPNPNAYDGVNGLNGGCYPTKDKEKYCESGYTLKENKCIKTVDSVYE